MKITNISFADGEIMGMRTEFPSLLITFKDYREVLFEIKFNHFFSFRSLCGIFSEISDFIISEDDDFLIKLSKMFPEDFNLDKFISFKFIEVNCESEALNIIATDDISIEQIDMTEATS